MNTILFPRLRRLATTVIALSLTAFASAQAPAKPSVAGKFIGNGKDTPPKFVLAEHAEPFGDEDAIKLIFTVKDPSKTKKPSFDAMFGELGSAIILSVNYGGKIYGCEVAHSAHEKQGFTSVGIIKMAEFKVAGGTVTGHVTTGGELDSFGEKWEVDLKFTALLPAKAGKAPAPKPNADQPDEPAKEQPKNAPAAPLLSARKLPVPKDATGVEFKQLVNQIQFSSPRSVAAVTKELSASLKQQGWKDGLGSVVGRNSSILNRVQGDAKLSITIQPTDAGSEVTIFTEGLAWDGADNSAPPAPPKPAADDDDGDIEKEINKALKDALKSLPKGL